MIFDHMTLCKDEYPTNHATPGYVRGYAQMSPLDRRAGRPPPSWEGVPPSQVLLECCHLLGGTF